MREQIRNFITTVTDGADRIEDVEILDTLQEIVLACQDHVRPSMREAWLQFLASVPNQLPKFE